jgi:hypothetical protein
VVLLNSNEVNISSEPLDSYGGGEEMEDDEEGEDGEDECEEIKEEVFDLCEPKRKRTANYTKIKVLQWVALVVTSTVALFDLHDSWSWCFFLMSNMIGICETMQIICDILLIKNLVNNIHLPVYGFGLCHGVNQ